MSEKPEPDPLTIDEQEEKRIVRACAGGDWKEFRLLFEKYREGVYFLALSIVKERSLARDVTQLTFIRVFKTLKWFNRRSRFSTWLYRVAYNQAIDQYRKKRRRGELEYREEVDSQGLHSPRDGLFRDIANRELGEKFRVALDSLPVKLRTAVVLKYIEGLTYSEICDIMGCARGVLQRRLERAGKKLRNMLKNNTPQ